MIRNVAPMLDWHDIFVKNFFDTKTDFEAVANSGKLNYPVDISQTPDALILEIACVGVDVSDIKITKTPGLLHIKYNRQSDDKSTANRTYISKSISRKSFDLGYKIPAKFDLDKISAQMDKGLLTITIPMKEDALPQEVIIN